jgi:hypothetical protein
MDAKQFHTLDESLMLCTNNEYSMNERQGGGNRRDADFFSKRPSQEEASSSIGLIEELDRAVIERPREKTAWNYGSAAVEKEAISPISIIEDKTIAENTEQSSERYDLNIAAKELAASLGEGQGKHMASQARQRLARRLERQAARNYRKSKSFDEIHSQDVNSTSEQNQTLKSKETELS